jgi:hypothetical protein
MWADGPELIQLGLVLCDVVVDFAPMFQVEDNHLVDQGEIEGGELTLEHLCCIPVVVIEDEVVEADPMSHQPNFTVGVPM